LQCGSRTAEQSDDEQQPAADAQRVEDGLPGPESRVFGQRKADIRTGPQRADCDRG